MTDNRRTAPTPSSAEQSGDYSTPPGASQSLVALTLGAAIKRAQSNAAALRAAARKARAPALTISGGGGFKARRGDRLFVRGIIVSFILLVIIPLISASIYLPFLAADQFASEARFAVRSSKSSPVSALAGLVGGGKQMQDSQIIASFLQSRAVIDELETRIDLKSVFATRGMDYWFGFSVADAKEKLVQYWKRQVSVNLDRSTGIMTIEVRAFRAEDALAICSALVEISERMVNDLTSRARRDALNFAEGELKRNQLRLEEALGRLRDIRNQEGVLDTDAQAVAINEVVVKLELSLSKIEQDIGTLLPQLSPDAPQLRYMNAQAKALRTRISELRRSIASDRTSESKSNSLSASATSLDRQKTEAKIAVEQYTASISAYEAARAEMETQGSFLLTFLKPSLAEEAEYPKRLLLWFTVVIPAFILWTLILGAGLLVRDNMPT